MFDNLLTPAHLLVVLFILFPVTIIGVLPYWFIFKKAGFSPWLSILMFVPMANLILLYVIAFSSWKVVPVPPYSVTQLPHQPYPPQG